MTLTDDFRTFLRLDQIANPVTYRWRMAGPWGDAFQELTVDVPAVAGDLEATAKLGGLLWSLTIAGAMTVQTSLESWIFVPWKAGAAPYPSLQSGGSGGQVGSWSPREDSGVLVMETGHLDKYSSRRMFVPGMPARWVAGRLLNHTGMRVLEGVSHRMVMGLFGHLTGGPLKWLLAYPDLAPPEIGNPRGVLFRYVNHIAVMHHTAKAPEATGGSWP